MAGPSKILRVAAVVAGTLGVIATTIAPAHAATYNVTTGGGSSGGANVSGSLTYTGKRTFTASFTLTDLCPGDGASAVAYFNTHRTGGGLSTFTRRFTNSNGCGSSILFANKTFTRPHNVRAIQVVVCREDLSAGTSLGCWAGAEKDNPST
jgi:hypothetical protein